MGVAYTGHSVLHAHEVLQRSYLRHRRRHRHRHIGGIGSVNNDGVKLQKSDNPYTEVIRRLCTSTGP